MSFFQNLWRDLVDKRLWPVAVALVLAAIAVPLIIGSGSEAELDSAAPAPAAPAAAQPQVAVADAPDAKQRSRSGKSRDPFKALVFAKVAKTASATAGTGAGTTPSSGGAAGSPSGQAGSVVPVAPSGSGTTKPGATPPGKTTPAAPSTTTTTRLFDYALSFQVKRSGKLATSRGVRAVSYVPSASYPLLSFLGVKANGKTATFLVSDRVTVSGNDRVCRPSRAACRFLELEAGDNVLLAKAPPKGQGIRHFRLMLGRVGLVPVRRTTTAKSARTARAAGDQDWTAELNLQPARAVSRTGR